MTYFNGQVGRTGASSAISQMNELTNELIKGIVESMTRSRTELLKLINKKPDTRLSDKKREEFIRLKQETLKAVASKLDAAKFNIVQSLQKLVSAGIITPAEMEKAKTSLESLVKVLSVEASRCSDPGILSVIAQKADELLSRSFEFESGTKKAINKRSGQDKPEQRPYTRPERGYFA